MPSVRLWPVSFASPAVSWGGAESKSARYVRAKTPNRSPLTPGHSSLRPIDRCHYRQCLRARALPRRVDNLFGQQPVSRGIDLLAEKCPTRRCDSASSRWPTQATKYVRVADRAEGRPPLYAGRLRSRELRSSTIQRQSDAARRRHRHLRPCATPDDHHDSVLFREHFGEAPRPARLAEACCSADARVIRFRALNKHLRESLRPWPLQATARSGHPERSRRWAEIARRRSRNSREVRHFPVARRPRTSCRKIPWRSPCAYGSAQVMTNAAAASDLDRRLDAACRSTSRSPADRRRVE